MDDNDNKKIGEEKTVPKKKRKYSTTKVKTRNLLTNLSFVRINNLDFENKSYVLDILTFIVQYLNIFLLDIKLETDLERNMLTFIWQNCLPFNLTNFISNEDNYYTLTKNNVKFKEVYLIIQNYMSLDERNYNEAKEMLKKNFDPIRYVFSSLFPKIYSRTNEIGREIKSKFDYNFLLWFNSGNDYKEKQKYDFKIQQQQQQQQQQQRKHGGKNMEDYKDRTFINEFEQKPIKNDLLEVIEILDDANVSVKSEITNKDKTDGEIPVNNENEINSFVKTVKPMNEVKKKFINEREKRKHEKLMKKKKNLEEQLKKNTEQYNLLKPVFKKKIII